MIALLSYLGAHWTLFIIVVLGTIGLGALAWFTKNLKYILAAAALVIAGLAYQSSNMDGYKRKVSEDAQAQVRVLQQRLLALSMITQADSQRATADAYLNSQLDTLSRETPHNDGPCLAVSAARRVWAVGQGAKPHTAPIPARRHPIVLPWRHGRT